MKILAINKEMRLPTKTRRRTTNANPSQLQNQEQKTLKSLHDGKQSTISPPMLTGVYDELKQVSTLLTQLIQNNNSMNQQRIEYQMYPQTDFPPQFVNTIDSFNIDRYTAQIE